MGNPLIAQLFGICLIILDCVKENYIMMKMKMIPKIATDKDNSGNCHHSNEKNEYDIP